MIPTRPHYLRLAVTGRCNLCCVYCRPEGASHGAPGADPGVGALRLLVECAAAEGVRKVRLTGGEPLLRADLEELVRAVSTVPGIDETVMTTNGLGLAARACGLRDAGLQRVNVSLDTLRPERMARMAGRDAVEEVLAGIRRAARVFPLVKTNTVVLRGWNDDELCELVRFAAEAGARARFIEYYPTLSAPSLAGLSAAEIRARLEAEFGALEPLPGDEGAVETLFRVPGPGATVGLIASAGEPPCERCAKLRVSPDGQLLPCLFDAAGVDISGLLAAGDADGVRRALREAFAAKGRCGRAGRLATSACRLGG
jgi:cyclic pyranopterin phosphate synthase